MRTAAQLANLRAHVRTGPSPYAVAVLRALLRRPMRLPDVTAVTHLSERCVKGHLTALRQSEAIKVCDHVKHPSGRGHWAVYAPVIHAI